VTFRPAVAISAQIGAIFETSVGVIHRTHEQPTVVLHADRGRPSVADADVASLVEDNLHATVDLEPERFEEDFDELDERRFGQTETEYKDWAVERLRRQYTTTVTYTGDNNVTYNKECEPNLSDISIQSIEPVYVPEIRQTTDLQSYSYPFEYFAAGPSRVTVEDGIHRCVHCDASGSSETFTYCENCGAISCSSHTKDGTAGRYAGLHRLCRHRTVRLEDEVLLRRGEPRGVPRGVRGDAAPPKGVGEHVPRRGRGGDVASTCSWTAGDCRCRVKRVTER